jgi:hypothetical protein
MRECNDFETFTDLWYTFLTAAKNVYTTLKKGAKSPQDRQWFGGKENERRTDPLLQYVFQARDDDEHGLDEIAEHVNASLGIGVRKEGYATGVILNTLPDGRLHVQSTDGLPVLIESRAAHVRLKAVTGRGPVTYSPPKAHLGNGIDGSYPGPVARMAVAYLEALVAEAERRA